MIVFTVPSASVRWLCALVGSTPYLCVALLATWPTAVLDGSVSSFRYYLTLFTIFSAYIVMICYVAVARMHTEQDYLFGGFKVPSILLGVVSLLRTLNRLSPELFP